jgi:hypothetical protein
MRRRLLLAALVAAAAPSSVADAQSSARAPAFAPPLDRPTPTAGEVVLRGELRSSLDGSTFDALTQRDQFPRLSGEVAPRVGGLFDPAAGGLRVVEQDPDEHVYRLVPTGAQGRACDEAGVASPCLAPRLDALAHERLVTTEAFAVTLGGSLTAEMVPAPRISSDERSALAWLAAVAGALGAGALARARRRARRASPFGQVRAAAAEARRALRGDATLARARDQIDELLARAGVLEEARRACAARLAKLEPARLAARRASWTGSTAPDAALALAALDVEAAEANQVAVDLASVVAGLDRIASSLRALVLRARAERGTRAVAAGHDPVDAMRGELALRDEAQDEASHALES